MTYQRKYKVSLIFMAAMLTILMLLTVFYIAFLVLVTALAYSPSLEELSPVELEQIKTLFEFSVTFMHYTPYILAIVIIIFCLISLITLWYAVKSHQEE